MRIVSSPEELITRGAVISIGNFDGVHLGHQMLLKAMQLTAERLSAPSAVITFFPPAKLFFSGEAYLSTPEEKVALLAKFEPDAAVVIPFDAGYAQTPKDVFVRQLEALKPRTLIVGEDFRFGHKREGSLNDLSTVTQQLEVFNLKYQGKAKVSSSRARQLLAQGHIEEVNDLLGRSYSASGEVIRGDQRGRSIGFPTANISTPVSKALPLGVLAVEVTTEAGEVYGGMANVGPRPSYPDDPPSLEVHLFGFTGDLYGQTLTVHFRAFIRAQRKFAGLNDLKTQLERDAADAKRLLL